MKPELGMFCTFKEGPHKETLFYVQHIHTETDVDWVWINSDDRRLTLCEEWSKLTVVED